MGFVRVILKHGNIKVPAGNQENVDANYIAVAPVGEQRCGGAGAGAGAGTGITSQ